MPQNFPYPFNDPYQGIVKANGELEIFFGPEPNQIWNVTQVTLEMQTAPAGCSAQLKYQGSLHAPAFSARRSAIGGDPPMNLKGGERGSVLWTGATPGDIGRILVIYNKSGY